MVFTALVTNGTTTTNPAPNTLTTKNPGWNGEGGCSNISVSSAWAAQANKAIFPFGVKDGRGEKPLVIHVVPGAGVTSVDVTAWYYNKTANTWAKFPTNTPAITVTAAGLFFIENALELPIFLQLSNFVGGTQATIYVDSRVATVL